MNRIHLFLTFLLACLFAIGCPPTVEPDDDDSTPPVEEDDDDAQPDDDDAADACSDPEDVTDVINNGSYLGDTNGEADTFTGSCSTGAVPDLLLMFTPDADGSFELSTDNAGTSFDTLIFAFSDCLNPGASELGCNDDGAQEVFQYSSDLTINAVGGEDVYIAIEGYDGTGAFELTITQVVCGDGIIGGTELCDDGNTDAGDGCDDLCQWECTDDALEPDTTTADATMVAEADLPAAYDDMLLCPTDMNAEYGIYADIWAVSITSTDNMLVTSGAGADGTACEDQQIVFQAYDLGLTELLGEGIANAENGCAAFAVGPGPGDFLVFAWEADQYLAPQAYSLTIDAGPPECGNGVPEPGEECDDGNLVDGDGCESDCMLPGVCGMVFDEDLGVIGETSVTVDLTDAGDDLPDLENCADPGVGGGDYMIKFTLENDGDLVLDIDHSAGGDAQYSLFHMAAVAGGSRDFADDDDSAADDDDSAGDDDDSAGDDDDVVDDDDVADDDDDDDFECEDVEIPDYGYCADIYPETAATFTVPATAGDWFLLIDAYNDELTGVVTVDFDAP